MDKELKIPIVTKRGSVNATIRRLFLIENLANPLGFVLFLLASSAIAYLVAKFGIISGALSVAVMVALPIVYCIVAYPRFGILVYLTFGYFIMWFFKLGLGDKFPLGTLMDGMEALFILGLFISQKKKKDWAIFKGPVTVMMLTWIGYNIFEVINPVAESMMSWLYTVRTVAIVMFMYFIFLYYITTKEYIRIIFKLWICLGIFAAIYAYKQEHIGFFSFEDAYVHSDPGIEMLLFIGGVWRKFSIFSDPVAFSYNMVTISLLCIGLITGATSRIKKIVLYFLVFLFLSAMLYSGTRGAYVLIPVTMLLLAILKFNNRVLIIIIATVVMGIVLINVPTSNQTLFRFQSAFKPSDDPSFNLRKMNQKKIQPYIQTHPMGGGLGATGEWGKRFAPDSYLANFPPDSGYVRVAVELGWLGLLLFCCLVFTILRAGILNYFTIKDPELKSYCLAGLMVVFALNFGNYPQEAIVQYPSNYLFYLMAAMLTITKRIDDQQNKQALCPVT